MGVLLVCVAGTSYVCSAHGGYKRVLDPLELEVQTVVNCHGVLGFEHRSSERVASTLYCWAISPASRSYDWHRLTRFVCLRVYECLGVLFF